MSYQAISVKEVVNKINADVNGWFLPPAQRPYVWGSRYESEQYICKLFDSLLRGYPIGGVIVWNADIEIPYREFMGDYKGKDADQFVDKGLWKRLDKWLVYDGQQRLQTLYSCLKYTFKERVLVYDMLFDLNQGTDDPGETGFLFIDRNASILGHYYRINELFVKQSDEDKSPSRKLFIKQCGALDEKQTTVIETNFDKLWDTFVKIDIKSIAYFPIETKDQRKVNEIFQRLNTGGVPLSQMDLLFSRIKGDDYDFEENLQTFSKRIFEITGSGYSFDAYSILQLLHAIIKETIAVDPDKIKKPDLDKFQKTWGKLERPLLDFFSDFIWGQFKINNSAIITKKLALIPLIVYFYEIYNKGFNFKNITEPTLIQLKKYLILSQVNDWNLQSIVDNFIKIVKAKSEKAVSIFDFPLNEFIALIDIKKQRPTCLYYGAFEGYEWFSLKILTPTRVYHFDPNKDGRLSPEIDHIFPKGNKELRAKFSEYADKVDIVWNMQPVKGEVNNYKRRKHPKEFFLSEDGKKYYSEYDFIPAENVSDPIWDEPFEFIEKRKGLMVKYLKKEYDLDIQQ